MIVGIFTVVFIFLFSLQTSLMSHFSVGGVTLDLALILAVYCGVLLKDDRGIWVGFTIGLIQDCLSGSLLGGEHSFQKHHRIYLFHPER